jgi:MATE family multidrug resistance protein
MVSVGLLYLIEPAALIRLFASEGSVTIVTAGTTMLTLAAVWQLFDGIGITLADALRAAGDTSWIMAVRIALAWGVFVPFSWIAVRWRGGGVVTLMLVLIVYILVLAVALAWRFASGRWREIQLVEPDVEA